MTASVFFVISYCLSFAAIILFPKSPHKQNGIVWFAASFLILMAFDGFAAGVCTLIGIKVSILTQGSFQLLLALLLGTVCIIQKKVQGIVFVRFDVLSALFGIALIGFISFIWFDVEFTPHYILNDPAAHFRQSLYIFHNGSVTGMYTAWNFIASWIGVLSPFIRFDLYYKVYLACDIVFLYFNGLIFYSCCRVFLQNRQHSQIISAIFSILYVLGYPLTCIIWGYCYLTVGISFGILLAIFAVWMQRRQWSTALYPLLPLALYGEITTYALFAPFIYLITFFFSLYFEKSKEGSLTARTLILSAALYIIPGLLGSWFFYIDILAPTSTTFGSSIAREGGMYRNLYSNLVLFAPLLLVSISHSIKNHQLLKSPIVVLFFVFVTAFILMLVPTYYLVISTYYLGKMQFIIWPFALLLAAEGSALCFIDSGKTLLKCYAAVAVTLFIMVVGKIDERVDRLYSETPIGVGTASGYHPYLDVYRWNFGNLEGSGTVSTDVWDIFHRAADYVEDGEEVPFLGAWMYAVWYRPITYQDDIDYYSLSSNDDNPQIVVDKIMSSDVSHVAIVLYDYADQGNNNADEACNLLLGMPGTSISYSNNAGYIVSIERS